MSDEDSLLKELARVAREDQEAENERLDRRWDALSSGELSAEEDETLRALAATDEKTAMVYEAFRPLDEGFRTRMAESVRFRLKADRRAPKEPATAAATATPMRRIKWWAPAALAVAASLLVVLLPPRTGPMPSYQLFIEGSVREFRSQGLGINDAGPRVFATGNRLRLVLTPHLAVDEPVAARFFIERMNEVTSLTTPEPMISGDGAVRLEGEVGTEVRLPAGNSTLLAVVGRHRSLPDGEDLRSRLGKDLRLDTADWVAFRIPVRVE